MDYSHKDAVTGLVLAGGRGSRMGGVDKGLVELAGRPLIAWTLDILQPQTGEVLINANRSEDAYRRYGHRVIGDRLGGFSGPLAGIAAGLHACRTGYLVTVPCDSPLLPADLVRRLCRQLHAEQAELCVAHNGERLQPVFALLSRSLLPSLERYLDGGGRKIDAWYGQHSMAVADFSDQPEAFLNINTPEDLADLAGRLENRLA